MKKINSSISLVSYVISVITICLWFNSANASLFWVSVILDVIGLYFAYKGKKLNESKGLSYGLIFIGMLLIIVSLLYMAFGLAINGSEAMLLSGHILV